MFPNYGEIDNYLVFICGIPLIYPMPRDNQLKQKYSNKDLKNCGQKILITVSYL